MSEKPLRFCMMTTFYPPYNFGGDGIFVHRLSNELARRGHRVDVIHCQDAYRALAGAEPTAAYDDHPNVTVHGLRSRFGFLSPLATQQTGRPYFKEAAIRRILQDDFDVIHFHNISLLGPGVLKYGRGVKLYTMHEYWLVCPTHVLFRFGSAACERPYCFACTLAHKRPPQWWRYTGLLASAVKNVDAFIAPSRFSKERHRAMGLTAPIVQLPHFVPAPSDSPWPAESDTGAENDRYFFFVGRLEKMKGVQTLIPIFRRFPKARLLIAGTGNYAPELSRLAEGCGNIEFLGRCSEQRLERLYARAVAVIVPSLCYESFGLVAIEAFRSRTPVIVRDIGALSEIAAESGAGLTYRTDDELIAAMNALLEDDTNRRSLGERGRAAYEKNWTAGEHLNRYLTLIGDIAARRSRGINQSSVSATNIRA